jgi:uncharacterized phage protein gp47/JayE
MSFTRPTLAEIYARSKADFKSGLDLQTVLRRSFIDIVAKIVTGASHVMHGHITWVLEQLLPDTAEDEFLLRWGAIWGIARNEATFAKLNITITGTPTTVVPAGTLFQRSDGFQYAVDTEVAIEGGGSVAALIVAVLADTIELSGNIDDGSTVSLVSAISGVDSDATVDSTDTEGDAEETLSDFRTRLIERIQNPPSGGTVSDYVAYAKTVTGVTRVWVLPAHLGEGTVGLTFVEDNEDPIIPDQAKVDEVQAAVSELKPVTADLFTFIPIATPIDPDISIKPNNADVRAAVTAELEDLIAREAQVAGAYKAVGQTYDGKIPLSKINEAISIAQGEEDHVLNSPTEDVIPVTGGIATLGTITFSTLA